MTSFGKKILAAFVEVSENDKHPAASEQTGTHPINSQTSVKVTDAGNKFSQYFDKLFYEANIPGPDYFEFSKMTEAMMSIADEKSRYSAAFAGLGVQGLDKTKLLHTANEYLKILEQDAASFNTTVDAALKDKVQNKQQEIAGKQQRIEQLTREISDLQNQIKLLSLEVKESEEKIESNSGSYKYSSGLAKQRIINDIEKISQYIPD